MATADVDPDFKDLMGKKGDYYAPPKVCKDKNPGGGEDCRLDLGHDGEHTNFWEVWA